MPYEKDFVSGSNRLPEPRRDHSDNNKMLSPGTKSGRNYFVKAERV